MRHPGGLATSLLAGALAGCNAVLGIEESPARALADAALDSDGAGGNPLTCGWGFASHRKIADLSARVGSARLFGQNLLAAPIPGNRFFRVVASHEGAGGPFELYAIDTIAAGNPPMPELVGDVEQPLQMLRLDASSSGVLSLGAGTEAGVASRFVLYRIDDTDRQGSSATAQPLLDTSLLGAATRLSALVSVTPLGQIALVTSFQASSTAFEVTLSGGSAGMTGSPLVLATDAMEANVRERAVVEIGGKTHVFLGLPGAPAGARQFSVAPGAATAPLPRTISNANSFLLNASSFNPASSLDVAFVDISRQVALLAGQIEPSRIETFHADELLLAAQFGGLTDVPFTTVPQWIGDNLVTLGQTGPAATDFTIIWADAGGHLRAKQKLDQAPSGAKIGAAAFAPQAQLGPLGGVLDVVWVVTSTDADSGEPYDVLNYDQIRCLQ
jgi:hypothetical protein